MNHQISVIFLVACWLASASPAWVDGPRQPTRSGRSVVPQGLPPAVAAVLGHTEWLTSGHEYGGACVRIAGKKVIYIDPVDLAEADLARKADIILITHPHPDHLSPEVLGRLRTASTWIVTVADCASRLKDWPRLKVIAPGQTTSIEDATIEAVPAYNVPTGLHPRASAWAGYVLTLDGVRVYHSGDTSFIPEMAALKQIDIAYLTVRAPYQMSGKELVAAVEAIRPRVAIPIHWQKAERPDAEYLAQHAPVGTKVMILR